MATTMISIDFPDGSIISYDRVRRDMILTLANGSVMHTGGNIPARPNPPTVFRMEDGKGGVVDVPVVEIPLAPVSSTVWVEKLGYKKAPILGSDIWNKRFLRLEPQSVGYYENDSTPHAKGMIGLNPGCTVRVIQAHEAGRKDRYENGHNPGVGGLMTMNIGSMMNQYSTPIGKPNCVELHVPVQVGNMLNTVMNSSVAGLAFGGGMQQLQKAHARTYYFSFDNLSNAQDFASQIENNVKVLNKANSVGGNTGRDAAAQVRAGNYGQIDGVLNMAHAMMANQKLMTSPDTSLEYYKTSLNTDLPTDVLYERLMMFYDNLAQYNVYSPYR